VGRATACRSAGASTILPWAFGAEVDCDSTADAFANGTRFAAIRSTVTGSGSDNPTAANVGTANRTAPMQSSCPERRRCVDKLLRYPSAAVITQGDAASRK
jgi:hypothetical protein